MALEISTTVNLLLYFSFRRKRNEKRLRYGLRCPAFKLRICDISTSADAPSSADAAWDTNLPKPALPNLLSFTLRRRRKVKEKGRLYPGWKLV